MFSTELVNQFELYTSLLKTVTVSDMDKPYMTEQLKKLRRQRQRVYSKSGRSQKYLEIKSQFDLKLKAEVKKYQDKVKSEVTEGKRNSCYAALRKLGVGGKDISKNTFTLPSHADNDYTPEQSAEKFADYFSSISQEYEPICVDKFTPNIRLQLEDGKTDKSKPVLDDWIYDKLKSSKKPNSTVPGDLPVKVIKELLPELAAPVACIYNKITQSGVYPRQWVVEYQVAIPKVTPALSEDET